MPRIVPIKELRNTNEISRICHAKDEPVFVTKQGYGDLVVMSVEAYDKLVGIADTDDAITASEAELAAGCEVREAGAALSELRRKQRL
ncbi:MAG: type II toxin-antitoxin system Phd/YefM family antitoxin [Clostridiales bacterium]|nr:type II toxin-antitoxin system Phd/YefM family antitoxin [Clostridiales bacterium]MDD7034711.1 type II toxin-antitoxin system prevent-host-death family antitoxin [Bacillota bacterium]MDY2919661.1 type II toxin-antitoxin system prevent-host-death family antitoxin [Lentihominibacter sp.]